MSDLRRVIPLAVLALVVGSLHCRRAGGEESDPIQREAEANLVNYSGMALESEGQRRWIVGLGHRQPLNYPFELRYGREEGKRLGKAAAITGTISSSRCSAAGTRRVARAITRAGRRA